MVMSAKLRESRSDNQSAAHERTGGEGCIIPNRPPPSDPVTSQHILTSFDDGVLSLELSRREKKNAITSAMYSAMSDALELAGSDSTVRAVLLRGQADLFTAGNDLMDFLDSRTREE